MPSNTKENFADLILKWVEENEKTKTITIKGELDIAVLAARIYNLAESNIEY